MNEAQMGFSFVLLCIGIVVTFVGYLYKDNQRLKEVEKNAIIIELDGVKQNQIKTNELIVSEKVSVSILIERVDTLEQHIKNHNQEIKEIKTLIFSEPELKMMIKENNEK